ncbi:MAG: HoxN/HupN/NixA family nickel/cobalt transporter [Alphaproteobacteria bacterium]|nr:HoxN/HupN/NixA family nickel/cobalt transporter [Alphaproteobacteria bacterium]
MAFHDSPVLLGTALLAYSFGLRHAVDADHIAAIDNVTRKLMQEGQRPASVGLFFSLGHSTVVVLATVAVAIGASYLQSDESFRDVGGVIGTSVSALFLFAIAITNLVILIGVYKTFRHVKNGGRFVEEDLDILLSQRGLLLGRIFRPLFRFIRASWQMYPLGFLFGLGFDTATEIGLLGISAAQAADGLSPFALLIFPALFTAGMALIDTLDSVLMLGAYGWAFVKPIRKLYYNLTITAVSVLVALLIGSVEALGLIAEKLQLHGMFWDWILMLNDQLGPLGYVIVGLFVVSWLISIAIYRLKGYDRLELSREFP